jgi:hypothetical protein
MMPPFSKILTPLFLLAILPCLAISARAQEGTLTAAGLATRLSAAVEDGDSVTRLRLNIKPANGGEKIVLQVQVKARRAAGKSEVVYQVLWPNERKGESFLLSQEGSGSPKGFVFTLPDKLAPLDQAQMTNGAFGSDLAYQDIIENFFSWENQRLAGTETTVFVEIAIHGRIFLICL